jgi:hypothetical protein
VDCVVRAFCGGARSRFCQSGQCGSDGRPAPGTGPLLEAPPAAGRRHSCQAATARKLDSRRRRALFASRRRRRRRLVHNLADVHELHRCGGRSRTVPEARWVHLRARRRPTQARPPLSRHAASQARQAHRLERKRPVANHAARERSPPSECRARPAEPDAGELDANAGHLSAASCSRP